MADMSALVSRLEAVAGRLESAMSSSGGAPAAASGGGDGGVASLSVEAFDEIISGPLAAFVEKSKGLGAEVAEISDLVSTAFAAQRSFLVVVAQSKKPDDAAFQSVIAETAAALTAVGAFKDKNFKSKQANHLSGVSEGIPALGWVTVSPKPCPYIKELSGAAQFYTNRVIKDFKETDKTHVEWARSWVAVLTDLEAYVKQHHTTGPSWNPRGGDATAAGSAAPAPKAAAPKAAPAAAATGGGDGAAKAGIFAALSKGDGVTSGLKKVDKSQMTHKNPELRGSSTVPASASTVKAPAKKWGAGGGSDVKKPPVLALQGKKWVCEYQDNNKEIVIETDGVNQTLYAYKCTGCTIQVKGKINAITLDNCKKTAIVFESCVAAFEIVNSQSVQAQVTGLVQTISIDKTDGAQIYLSKESLGASIVSAKSSEMNVSVPNPTDPDGDMLEMPVPEQYKTVFNPELKKLETLPTDIAG